MGISLPSPECNVELVWRRHRTTSADINAAPAKRPTIENFRIKVAGGVSARRFEGVKNLVIRNSPVLK
jgi:hypothetical protein